MAIRVVITERNNLVTVSETTVLVRVTEQNVAVTIGEGSGSSATYNNIDLTEDTDLTSNDHTSRVSNTGATGPVVATLPASDDLTIGWWIDFRVTVAEMLTLQAQGTDTIRFDTVEGSAGGLMQSDDKGTCARLEYEGNGEFFVVSCIGNLSDGT